MLLEQILASENLQAAWKHVKQNKGSAGVDGITLDDYLPWATVHWQSIRRGLMDGLYCPLPVRRVEIPKPNGDVRLLGIPSVNDRVIQQAISQALQPLIDPDFSDYSYGFRPKRSAHHAVYRVRQMIIDQRKYAVDIDLSKFFDKVDHDLLMHRLTRWIDDKRVLELIGKYLRAGISEKGNVVPSLCGVPQGGPLSPLLANVMLNDLDRYMESQGYQFARYADDFVVGVRTQSEGQHVKQQLESYLKRLKLPINEAKSSVLPMRKLNFLGFAFRGKKIVWSEKALANFKHRIRELTGRSWGVSWWYRYKQLRLYLVGWVNYYGLHEYYRPIPLLDQWIRRRIRMCYLKQWRKPRTRARNLMKRGVPEKLARSIAASCKGYYRLAKTKAVHLALNNKWLTSQGLVSVKEQWSKFHYSK
jgi:RNA-directed DNA polymerase